MYVILVIRIHRRMKEGEEEDYQIFSWNRGILLKAVHKNYCMLGVNVLCSTLS